MSTVQVPKLNTKDLLTLEELTKEEIISLIEFAIYLKKNKQEPLLQGKILGLIFDKHSTRTRVSFEAGMVQLGDMVCFKWKRDANGKRRNCFRYCESIIAVY